MGNPELTFVDEKECRQVCSTIIMSFCKENGEKVVAPKLNVGKSVIQMKKASGINELRKTTEKDNILRISISECLEYLKILTPAELVINSRDLLISSRKPGEMSEEPFSINKLVLEEKDKMFPGGIIFIQNTKLDIENLSFDVDKVEVKVLEYLQISETFNIQSRILGEKIELPIPDNRPLDLDIQPFLSIYLPHMVAKEFKHEFIDFKNEKTVKLDIIGMLCSTVSYTPFLHTTKKEKAKNKEKYNRVKIKNRDELISRICEKIGEEKLKEHTKGNIKEKDIKSKAISRFLASCSGELDLEEFENKGSNEKSDHRSLITNPISFDGVIEDPTLNYGIQPVAIWIYRDGGQ